MRQNEKRRLHNRRYRSAARTYVKRTRNLIAAGELDEAEAVLRQAVSTLDKAARKKASSTPTTLRAARAA